MALTLTYYDAYLKNLITEEREARAFDDVEGMGEFPDDWKNKLTVLRAYLLVCMESAATTEDVFSLKLGQYRKEFTEVYRAAQAAIQDTNPVANTMLTIPIERA